MRGRRILLWADVLVGNPGVSASPAEIKEAVSWQWSKAQPVASLGAVRILRPRDPATSIGHIYGVANDIDTARISGHLDQAKARESELNQLAVATNTQVTPVIIDVDGQAFSSWLEGQHHCPDGLFVVPNHVAMPLANGKALDGEVFKLTDRPGHADQRSTLHQLLAAHSEGSWTLDHDSSLQWHLEQGTSKSLVEGRAFRRLSWIAIGEATAGAPFDTVSVTICYGLVSLGLLGLHDIVRSNLVVPRCPGCGVFHDILPKRHRDRLCEPCALAARRSRQRSYRRGL